MAKCIYRFLTCVNAARKVPKAEVIQRGRQGARGSVRFAMLSIIGFMLVACSDDTGTHKPHNSSDNAAPISVARPNILLVVADDLGYNDLAINNVNTSIQTPNLDQFAQKGVRFTRHYANAVCSPARAALLTGQYAERNGYLPNGRGISPEVTTMPEQLQQAGYTTWHIGKWHIGDLQRAAWPDHQGFDHWFGFLNQWRLAGKHNKKGEIKLFRPRYENPWLEGDGMPGRHYEGHLENILTDKAIDTLSELSASEKPWFLNLWYYAPHTPISPAVEFARLYPDNDEGRYAALVNQLDSNIGRLLSHLDNLGLSDNTIVVVVSDNGGTNRQVDNNAPFFGRKGTVLEGGLRTPLIIRWPNEADNKKVFTDTISTLDLFPTLMESLGIASPSEVDGVSFYRSIRGEEPAPVRTLFWEQGLSYSALSADGRWRLYSLPTLSGGRAVPKVYDMETDFTGSREVSPLPEPEVTQLLDKYQAWSEDVHRVKTRFTGDANGNGILTGMSFQRTPGYGGYTFAVGLSEERQGQLVAQQGAWNMSRTGDTITAHFGDINLSGRIKNTNSCHSIVISGVFYRHTSSFSGPEKTTLSLYVDGEKVDSVEAPTMLPVKDTTVPTIIGDPNGPMNEGFIYSPVVLNLPVDTFPNWSLLSLDERICRRS